MAHQKSNHTKVLHTKSTELAHFFAQLQGQSETSNPDNAIEIDNFILNHFSANDRSVKLFFDAINFKILAMTKNLDSIFDINPMEITDLGAYMAFLPPEHLLFIASHMAWSNTFLYKDPDNLAYTLTLCGLTFLDKKGKPNRMFIRVSPLSFNENKFPQIVIVTIDKINFMMKSDICWMRVAYGENESKTAHISTVDEEGKKTDILSDREKEILQLLSTGMDTKEIAETLFISTNTIIKHRKNMLARTGLCDTTALIQICQSCGIL
jgi:DNA-binding CsgD family transcriptional regulator